MDFKLVGSILLIVGTSIGAGMLGLPIATAELGFVGAMILLFLCWFVMTVGALLILEVNLWLPQNSNLISMAKATIGPVGQLLAWLMYFLLLYSLLCAYIAGGSDLFHNLLLASGINLPAWLAAIIFTTIFGLIVYMGIRMVDYVNRGLMIIKLTAYFLVVILLAHLVSFDKLMTGNMRYLTSASAIMVTIASFGYATIVPSLRVYFAGDVHKLRKAIIIGSTIPLICYIAWDIVIMGVIPLQGNHGLIAILNSSDSASSLVNTLTAAASKGSITFFIKLFTSICVLTSFLGVSLCLVDFFADGFQVEKKGSKGVFIHLFTFLPPLIIVLVYKGVFIGALKFAGIYSVILLILLPAWMTWRGRYTKQIAKGYQVFGGKSLLAFLLIFSMIVIVKSIVDMFI